MKLDRPIARTAFEVKIYNREVRELAKQNKQHDALDGRWADLNSRVIRARDADEARRLAQSSWPPEQGFVISSVSEVTLQ